MSTITTPIPSRVMCAGKVTVHKFGGTSVGGPAQFKQVALILNRIVGGNHEFPVVVVSAMSGVTNRLYECIDNECDDLEVKIASIVDTHRKCVNQLGLGDSDIVSGVESDLRSIRDMSLDVIVGLGEIWSAKILAALLSQNGLKSKFVNARDFLFLVDSKEVRVDWNRSHWPKDPKIGTVFVVTGFLASAADGSPTTLKRNGSDHSGAIVARLVRAAALTIWTDVDGIYSADPRAVSSAHMIPSLSYREAAELAYFGAKVIHPQTMAPCVNGGIPIVLRNTFNVDCAGTVIGGLDTDRATGPARAVTTIADIALINVEGSGLFGFSGIAAKLFAAVAAVDVNIIMITQASSEYSICFAVPRGEASVCEKALREIFASWLDEGCIEISVADDACIIAVVGDGMHAQTGLLGKLASALGKAGVSIRALAQGSSERNITFVVSRNEMNVGLQMLHDSLHL
jgi:bifunctional aspartokinase / homoserine dehydrogenase 1